MQTKSGLVLVINDQEHYLEIEVTINKKCELINSHLIRTYALIDRRFGDLSLLIKTWNKRAFPDRT